MEFLCHKCSKVFSFKNTLVRHEKKCQSQSNVISMNSITCPECNQIYGQIGQFRIHVQQVHGIPQEEEKVTFKSKNDFEAWKEKIEKENLCFYHTKRSHTRHGQTRTYFYCHRSGFFKSSSKGVRRIKSQGTNKINASCTSSMVLIEDDNTVECIFHKSHFGHGINLGRCRLTPEERSSIADLNISEENMKEKFEHALVSHENKDEKKKILQDISQKLEAAKGLILRNEYTEDETKRMNKMLDNFLQLASNNKRKIKNVEKSEPVNKQIEKQFRFKSNKKKNVRLNASSSLNENNAIKTALNQAFDSGSF